jgi:hypothetical protein
MAEHGTGAEVARSAWKAVRSSIASPVRALHIHRRRARDADNLLSRNIRHRLQLPRDFRGITRIVQVSEIGKAVGTVQPIIELALCFSAIKLAKRVFGCNIANDAVFQTQPQVSQECADDCRMLHGSPPQ